MQNNLKKKLKSLSAKKLLILFFVFCFLFSGPKKVWAWDAMPAAIFEVVEAEISYVIKGMIMGSLRTAAIKMLSKQVDRFVSGVSGNGVRFITDWEDYLIDNPARNTQRYMNDYISHALSGKGSTSYKKAPNSVLGASTISGEGFGNAMVLGEDDEQSNRSYEQDIKEMAQKDIIDDDDWSLNYSGNPDEMLAGENFADANEFVWGNNTIWDANAAFEKEKEKKLEEEKQVALVEGSTGQGFLSEKTDGMVTKPAILIKELKANQENLPNLALASASSLGELIAAAASKAISSSINKAVSGVERTINREVTKVTNKAVKEVNKSVNAYGPGELYK
jgi:hypothetical protein